MDIDLTRLDPDRFENLCNDLLMREFDGVKSIEGAGGDDGIDGFKGEITGKITIYQHKFLTKRIRSSEKRQIKKSYQRAKDENPGIEKWVLLIATEFTPKEQEWFEKEIKEDTNEITVDYWNKNEIKNRLGQHPDLVDRYFQSSIRSLGEKLDKTFDFLSGGPLEKVKGSKNMIDEIRSNNPHLGIGYEFNSEEKINRITMDPDFSIRMECRFRSKKEKLKRLENHEEVQFSEEELEKVKIHPQSIFGRENEPSKMKITPSYKDREKDVLIELPDIGYQKEITISPNEVTDEYALVKSDDGLFNISIKFFHTDEDVEDIGFDIGSPNFEGKTTNQIKSYFGFIDNISRGTEVLIRSSESDEIILVFETSEVDIPIGIQRVENIVDNLYTIEKYTQNTFVFSNDWGSIDSQNAQIASSLLSTGRAEFPCDSFNLEVNWIAEELSDGSDNEYLEDIAIEYGEFTLEIGDNEVTISDVRIKLPKVTLSNIDEVKGLDDKETIEIELKPIETPVIEVIE